MTKFARTFGRRAAALRLTASTTVRRSARRARRCARSGAGEAEARQLLATVAGVLHLGDMEFEPASGLPDADSAAKVARPPLSPLACRAAISGNFIKQANS